MERGKTFSGDMLSRSFTCRELLLNQFKQQHLPPEFQFATPTHDIQTKSENYMVKHETVLPSQKGDCQF